MEEKKEVKETKKERYSLAEVPTQTAVVIKDSESEEYLDMNVSLCKILNILNRIEKNIV